MEEQTPLVVVVPATSNSGAQAVRSLLSGKLPVKLKVRAAVRSSDKASKLFIDVASHENYELLAGIDASSESGVAAAFTGAKYAVIVTPHDESRGMTDDAQFTANMINAAKAAGVKHIVYVGSWTVNAPDDIKVISSRFVPSEALLKELSDNGGPNFTSLRAGYFFQNYKAWIAGIKSGCVKWPNFVVPAVDPRDMGRVAAAILASEDPAVHHGQYYEISGPKKMTTKETVDIIARKLGKEVTHEEIPYESLVFLPGFLQELFTYMGKKGEDAVPFSEDTRKICGENTSFEEWLDSGFLEDFKVKESSE